MLPAPVAEAAPASITAGMAIEGDTVVYTYPEPVTVATGAEDLRLALDSLDFTPVVEAVAAGVVTAGDDAADAPAPGAAPGPATAGVSAHPASMVRVAATAISGAVRTRGAGLGC